MTAGRTQPELDARTAEVVVAAAAAAPSILNSQPWRFHATADRIDVFVVPARVPALLDTGRREVHLSIGAALLNLRLALAAAGMAGTVELVPSALDPNFVATIRIAGRTALTDDERALYEAIPDRRSNRLPFTGAMVPYEEFDRLQEAAAIEGARLEATTGLHRAVVTDALHEADRIQRNDRALVDEVTLWTVDRAGREDVGIPTELLGPVPRDPKALVRDLALGRAVGDRESADFEEQSLMGVLLTSGDERADWLRGGMALERVLLTATARGLCVGLLSQATEVPELRHLARDSASAWRHPQIVLRFGYGQTQPASPRLPLSGVLEIG
jgi:hypothetical protein